MPTTENREKCTHDYECFDHVEDGILFSIYTCKRCGYSRVISR